MRFFVGWRLNLFCGVAGLALGIYGTNVWHEAQDAKALRGQVKEANVQIEREHQSDAATQATGEAVAVAVDRVQWRTRTIIREVPIYVTPETDAAYGNLPNGFVRLHDAAATGTPPVPLGSGESDGAPSNVAPSAAISGIVDNYGTCNVWREQVIGWQSWHKEQSALWAGEGSPTPAAPRRVP
jgi:hypothetical protein